MHFKIKKNVIRIINFELLKYYLNGIEPMGTGSTRLDFPRLRRGLEPNPFQTEWGARLHLPELLESGRYERLSSPLALRQLKVEWYGVDIPPGGFLPTTTTL